MIILMIIKTDTVICIIILRHKVSLCCGQYNHLLHKRILPPDFLSLCTNKEGINSCLFACELTHWKP